MKVLHASHPKPLRRSLRWLPLLALTWIFMGHAGVELDQQVFGWHGDAPVAVGGDSEQMLAQTYESRRDGTLDHVRIVIGCSIGSPGKVTVELREVLSDGTPSHVVLAATTRLADSFASAAILEDIAMPAIPITSGTDYALILSATADAQCATRQGGNEMFRSSGVRDAFFDARPNPPGWVPWIYFGIDGALPFSVYVDAGTPTGPRFCDFETADGVPNDWLPNDVPLCGCARDPGLVAHRCWFATPDFVLWRTLPRVFEKPRVRAEWSLVPMVADLPGISIKEYDPDGQFASDAIHFKAGAKPGKPIRQNAFYTGGAKQSEVMILIDGKPEPISMIFETLLDIPKDK